ncbi:response regulator [Candidatus Bipolaricaulota bacterium]|nr:response regulator [Candidatus Bipolaricaulota bacterium]
MSEGDARDNILIVDDSPDNLRVLGEMLRARGYRVRTAVSGEHALESVRASLPDLILLDIRMPGMNGFDVCRTLKADPSLQNIPILFLSAVAGTDSKIEAFASGGVDYITKPFQAEEVLSRIDTHLTLSMLRTRLEEQVKERTAALVQSQEDLRSLASKLRRLGAHSLASEENERKRLARDLHDLVGQNLTVLGIAIQRLAAKCVTEEARSILDDAQTLLYETVERVHNVMSELRPPVLDDYGIASAIRWYAEQFAERTGLPITVEGVDLSGHLDANVETALYRVTQEAVTNIVRHAQASKADINVTSDQKAVRIVISDDGIGFDPDHIREPGSAGGWGHIGMRERIELIGGSLSIESARGRGTRVVMEVPL